MPISRPFAYNPTLQTDGVSQQFETLSVGFTGQTYGNSPGGLKWWNGPDEELGNCIGTSLPTGGILAPDGIYGDVTFWRTSGFSQTEFLTLSNTITNNNFQSAADAAEWFRSNGYWTTLNPNSYIIVGGQFTSYSGISINRIVRLNTDGSYDSTFNVGTGFDNTVFSLPIQSDGKIVVGGFFTSYSGISINRIVRLNTDGSYDPTFNVGTGFNSNPRAISIQSDGKIIVGGGFTTYQGTSRNRIVRLDTDGSYDSTFNIGTGFNNVTQITSIQSDGKIIYGGFFTSYSGISINRIVRLNTDGSYDPTFNVGTGFNSNPRAISIQSDGKIIVGGVFTAYQGTTRNRIARLNTDGSYDSTFNIGTGFDSTVSWTSIQSDGKIIVGGLFTSYSGISSNRIARLNADGSYDSTFNIGTGFTNEVRTIHIQSNEKILIGGEFTSYSGISSNYIIRLNSDGSRDSTFNIGTGFNLIVVTSSLQNLL